MCSIRLRLAGRKSLLCAYIFLFIRIGCSLVEAHFLERNCPSTTATATPCSTGFGPFLSYNRDKDSHVRNCSDSHSFRIPVTSHDQHVPKIFCRCSPLRSDCCTFVTSPCVFVFGMISSENAVYVCRWCCPCITDSLVTSFVSLSFWLLTPNQSGIVNKNGCCRKQFGYQTAAYRWNELQIMPNIFSWSQHCPCFF